MDQETHAAAMNGLYALMGLERIAQMDETGRAVLEYRAREEMCHSGGVVQGGFVTGWIDAAMAHAAVARHGFQITPMSLEIKVSFLAPARPGLLIASGWVVREGRRIEFYEGDLRDRAGSLLAKASSTVKIADGRAVALAAKRAREGDAE